ncbi:alanine/glycine:cation symporter family protein [Roseburia amylophila]|uniref:Alanine:cation symporter family protein n=1 Tax=Roseburia amylophila TaxID=2981794 RepID=A0ABT2SB05_9FIRM|nr:alanine/glycine:cation symporter family protein [Roseburia amylophila]MCU6716232.1 alanine:cation symporter family protein [Roseburia amylophila]CDC11632.1 amino acid carrier protein [Roseburia sp. CAG:45]SCH28860.1 Na+/alanine symporter [uncultured Roseburia sp.]
MVVSIIEKVYSFLWGDWIKIPLPGGGSLGISLLIILLIPTGIYFTIRTKFLQIRLFPDMVRALVAKKEHKDSLSTFQTLIVSTATRVGMGNLVGVVAAVSAGGAGAVFWMWITALIGSATAFIEATLAQLHKEKDPLYGGYRGGPAYYIHHFFEEKSGKKKKHVLVAVLFAISGLICWCGISQVISNSVASSFENAFHIPPLYTTIVLVAVAAVIVLRKNATVKVLDMIVPIMAVCYFFITLFIIIVNFRSIPGVFGRIFEEAFGIRQVVSGGFGAVLMNGVKRGLFSNEAGSGSAPCAAAAAECDNPVRAGLTQALGVFIDTIIICSCTAMIMLIAPEKIIAGKAGMDLLQSAMQYHLGRFGVIFIALTLFLFSFSTFLGILFYARSNVAYLFGDKWIWQTLYKIVALIMLFIGGIATYTFVWDLGDVGIGLMTIFNIGMLYLMGGQALKPLSEYGKEKKTERDSNQNPAAGIIFFEEEK